MDEESVPCLGDLQAGSNCVLGKRRCCDVPRVSSVPVSGSTPGTEMIKFGWFKNRNSCGLAENSFGNLNFRLQICLCGPVSWLEVLDFDFASSLRGRLHS